MALFSKLCIWFELAGVIIFISDYKSPGGHNFIAVVLNGTMLTDTNLLTTCVVVIDSDDNYWKGCQKC